MRQLKKYIYFNGSGWREDFCPTKHRQLTKGSEEGAVALDKVPISTQNSRTHLNSHRHKPYSAAHSLLNHFPRSARPKQEKHPLLLIWLLLVPRSEARRVGVAQRSLEGPGRPHPSRLCLRVSDGGAAVLRDYRRGRVVPLWTRPASPLHE